jgi:RNA polymerase sigma factor (sigma-70 family)
MVERAELFAYARQLGDLLCQVYGGTVSDRFARKFVSEALHLAPSDYEDLGQIVFLECYDLVSQGGELSDKTLEQIVHRIRQRLARHARRELQIDPSLLEQCSARRSEQPSAIMSESALKRLIDDLSPDEALVLHLSVFEGRAPRDIAGALGVSLATIYRRLDSAKTHLKALIS